MSKLEQAQMAFTFDDFVLSPIKSDIKSRKDPKINVDLPNFKFDIPIISAPMVVTMCELGGTGVLHRYMPIEYQVSICRNILMRLGPSVISDAGLHAYTDRFYAAMGTCVSAPWEAGVHGFCIDIANGRKCSVCPNNMQ